MAESESDSRTSVVPFEPGLLDRVRAFSERYWSRPRSPEYYEWRYLRPQAFSRMFVALRGRECVGTLCALRKPWRVRAERESCLEVFDWHALEDARRAGVGIRLMRAMMRQPERLLSVGGTADVHAALPLMGWQALAVARAYELTLSVRLIAERARRARGVPPWLTQAALGPLEGPLLRPPRHEAPCRGGVSVADAPEEGVSALYEEDESHGMAHRPDPEVLRWMTASRWSGAWRYLHFRVDGRLCGWAMTRTYLGKTGRQASLVEVFAPGADAARYAWMVSEACRALSAERPTRILARASCPVLRRALELNRFRHSGVDAPVHAWPRFEGAAPANPHFTLLHSDAPFLPYDTERLTHSEHP